LQNNFEKLVKSFEVKNKKNDDGLRGIVILPTEIESYREWSPVIKYFENLNLSFHQTCIKTSGMYNKRKNSLKIIF
jgi:hypothetical protein